MEMNRMSFGHVAYSREHWPEMFEREKVKAPEDWKIEAEKVYADNGYLPGAGGHHFCPVGRRFYITRPDGVEVVCDFEWPVAFRIARSNPDGPFRIKWTYDFNDKKKVQTLTVRADFYGVTSAECTIDLMKLEPNRINWITE